MPATGLSRKTPVCVTLPPPVSPPSPPAGGLLLELPPPPPQAAKLAAIASTNNLCFITISNGEGKVYELDPLPQVLFVLGSPLRISNAGGLQCRTIQVAQPHLVKDSREKE